MPNIIYQTNPGQLIAQGDRTVSTFQSGLIRVDQSFMCATLDAASQRALLQVESNFPGGNEPAIDGIYIYPDIQEKRQSNGFTEFIVSGYGRTQTTLQNEQITTNTILTTARNPLAAPGTISTQTIYISNNIVSGYIVIEKNSGLDVDDLGFATDYFNRYNILPHTDDIQTRITSFDTTEYGLYVDWNGDLKRKSFSRIGMQFSYTTGEFGDTDVYYYQYANPFITVINRNNFGKFIELEIEVK